jgi:hypothetical protein
LEVLRAREKRTKTSIIGSKHGAAARRRVDGRNIFRANQSKHLRILLLVTTDFERLATLDRVHVHLLARAALKAQHNLLRRLRLLVEHGLGLTTVTRLLAVVTTLPYVSSKTPDAVST